MAVTCYMALWGYVGCPLSDSAVSSGIFFCLVGRLYLLCGILYLTSSALQLVGVSPQGFTGPAELGVPLKTGKGVCGSRVSLVFFMHKCTLSRLVLNEGCTSAF